MIAYSKHADEVLRHRNISRLWVERVYFNPTRMEVDKLDPDIRHFLGKIEENGNRVLRVVVNVRVAPNTVITAFFDRRMIGMP